MMKSVKFQFTDLDYIDVVKLMDIFDIFINKCETLMKTEPVPKQYEGVFDDEFRKVVELRRKLQSQFDEQKSKLPSRDKAIIEISDLFDQVLKSKGSNPYEY